MPGRCYQSLIPNGTLAIVRERTGEVEEGTVLREVSTGDTWTVAAIEFPRPAAQYEALLTLWLTSGERGT